MYRCFVKSIITICILIFVLAKQFEFALVLSLMLNIFYEFGILE